MTKYHLAAALLAFGSLAMLPACSVTDTRTSSAAPMPSSPELSPGMVRQVQTALQQQGLYTGSIDGIWGPATEGALLSFQRSHALRPTGQLNSPTLAALNVPAGGAAPAMQPAAATPAATTSSAAPAMQPVTIAPAATTSSTMPATPAVAASSTTPTASTTP